MKVRSNYINENIFSHKISSYRMIDISIKRKSYRRACVVGSIYVGKIVFNLIKEKKIQKGDPLLLAEIAGINAVKNTSNLILLCHQINIENIFISVILDESNYSVKLYCVVFAYAKTGVEMEAMSGVSIGLLTIYDLTKKLNPFICIKNIELLFKDGGENGLILGSLNKIPLHLKKIFFVKKKIFHNLSVVLITISDRASSNIYTDDSGKFMYDFFYKNKANILDATIISDNKIKICNTFTHYIEKYSPDLILTSGGTGLSYKDVTNDAVLNFCTKIIPGIGELLRYGGSYYTKTSWLSCSVAGIYNKTLILSLPGKPSAVLEGLDILGDLLLHAINIIKK